jgi:hypothetical protein
VYYVDPELGRVQSLAMSVQVPIGMPLAKLFEHDDPEFLADNECFSLRREFTARRVSEFAGECIGL